MKNKNLVLILFITLLLLLNIKNIEAKSCYLCGADNCSECGPDCEVSYENKDLPDGWCDFKESAREKNAIASCEYEIDGSKYKILYYSASGGDTASSAWIYKDNKRIFKEENIFIESDVRSKNDCPSNIDITNKENQISIKSSSKSIANLGNKVNCGNITDIPKILPDLTSWIVKVIQVFIPVVLVIMGSIDLIKGIMAQKEDEIKKGQHIFIKRLCVAVIIFFVFIIVKFIISIVAKENTNDIISCMSCFLEGTDNCDL